MVVIPLGLEPFKSKKMVHEIPFNIALEIIENYLNEKGLWWDFSEWLKQKEGKTPTELGFSDDE